MNTGSASASGFSKHDSFAGELPTGNDAHAVIPEREISNWREDVNKLSRKYDPVLLGIRHT
jgi:hypothetical protein